MTEYPPSLRSLGVLAMICYPSTSCELLRFWSRRCTWNRCGDTDANRRRRTNLFKAIGNAGQGRLCILRADID